MKKTLIILMALAFNAIGFAAYPVLDPDLREAMRRCDDDEKLKINILMVAQADQSALSIEAQRFVGKQQRRAFIVESLKHQAEASQTDVMALLHEMEQNGMVDDIRPLWIVNSISCMATKTAINNLADRRDIMTIYHCVPEVWIDDTEASLAPRDDGREIAENLLQVNAPQAWELGYTGQDVLVGLIDTGVRLDHADLAGRLWDGGEEYPNHGYDFYYHDNDPSDDRGHGTHVAGTICGTGVSGTQTGIAPGATIMALKAFNSDGVADETHWIAAMQFAVEHGADVMNMSLGRPQPNAAQKLMMRQACDNALAAGAVVSACAGNFRQMQFMIPPPNNLYTPGDCPPPHLHEDQMVNAGGLSCVITVGAVDYSNALAPFSSEGPSQWTDVPEYNDYPYTAGSPTAIGLIKPDICAPGVQIKSLDFNTTNGYTLMDGTSMATPLVTGAIALMLSKNHELTPAQIDEILERTTFKLTEHKSTDFGSGLLDAYAAVQAVDYDEVTENTQEVSVFPNPSSDCFTVTCEGMNQIKVFAIDGRLVQSIETQSDTEQIKGLADGVYVLQITRGNKTLMRRIVKL